MAEAGNLFAGDLLWSPALGAWTPAGSIESLRGLVRPAAAPPRGRWWVPAAIAAGLALAMGVGFLLYSLLSHASPSIKEYHPKEGPAGSYVILELSGKPKPGMKVRYGGAELPFTGLGERCIGVNIPVDGGSDTLRLYDGDREAGAAAFTVQAPVVTPLYEAKLSPSAQKQVVRTKEGFTVTLPGGFLKRERTLSIARVENAAVYRDDPFKSQEVFDISIEGLEQLDGTIEIGIPYDPAKLDAGIPVEANFTPARWDVARKRWVDLYYRVDESTHTVHFLTDHLSLVIGGISAVGIAQAAVTAVVVGGTVGELAERWANDKYLSRDWKVRVLYSDAGLRETFPDKEWKAAIAPANLYLVDIYDLKYSCAVQDIAHILEESLKCCTEAGFPDPTQKSFLGVPYRRYVKVKIDSLFSYTKGELAQESFWDTIHIPTEIIKLTYYDRVLGNDGPFEQNFNFFKANLAHELFHSIQGQYYGAYLGALPGTEHKWWKEATAEWAGNDLAKVPYRSGWEQDPSVLFSRLGPRFLSYPVNSLGKRPDTCTQTGNLEYEYLAAVFVRYLVREMKYDFKGLVSAVGAESRFTDPLAPLAKYVRERSARTLDSVYADYAAWIIAQTGWFLSDFDGKHPQDRVIGAVKEILRVDAEKVSLRISQKNQPANGHILVFRSPKGVEILDPGVKPLVVLTDSRPKAYEIEARDKDILYIIAANTSAEDRIVDLLVEEKKVDPKTKAVKWEGRNDYALQLRKNGTAGIWALKVTAGLLRIEPSKIDDAVGYREVEFTVSADALSKEINKVRLAYDFGDNRKDSKGEMEAKMALGLVRFSLKHTYEPSPGIKPEDKPLKYDLTAVLFNGDKKLGEVTAPVTVAKAEVVIRGAREIILDLSAGGVESAETFTADAKPSGRYRFEWDFGDGGTFGVEKKPGEESTARHTYKGLKGGVRFTPRVKLYSREGVLLAEDAVVVRTEGAVRGEYDCGWEPDPTQLRRVDDSDGVFHFNATNKQHGLQLKWHDASRKQLIMAGCYRDGKQHGLWTFWHPNGNKHIEQNFVDGVQNGVDRRWYPSGAQMWEHHYKDGITHGLQTWWYENGKMQVLGNTVNGSSVGIWTHWREDGSCERKQNWDKFGKGDDRLPCD